MKSFQDKLCDGLTLLGLVCVIVGGIYALISQDVTDTPEQTNISAVKSPADPDKNKATCIDSLKEISKGENKFSKIATVSVDTLQKDTTKTDNKISTTKDSLPYKSNDSILKIKSLPIKKTSVKDTVVADSIPQTPTIKSGVKTERAIKPDSIG